MQRSIFQRWALRNLVMEDQCIAGTAEPGAAGAVAPHFFPNIMLKQLRFKTLVVQFPREAYKMLYFYLKPPHSRFRSAVLGV